MAIDKQTQPSAGASDKASIESAIEQIDRQIKQVQSFDVSAAREGWHSGIDVLQRKINTTLGDCLGTGTPEYRRHVVSEKDFVLDMTFGNHYSVAERKDRIREGIKHSVARLNGAKRLLAERLEGVDPADPTPTLAAAGPTPTPTPPLSVSTSRMPMSPSAPVSSPVQSQPVAAGGRVVVLGLGGDSAAPACEFLEQLGLEAAVLDTVSVEQLDSLRDATYLLLLPGGDADAAPAMLAIGFMLAVLGRNRIACLLSGQGAVPKVLQGATTVAIDESGVWRLLLAREMKRAGLDVDLNRAL
jgi:hypothetical protein